MKKFIRTLLILTLSFCLTACNGSNNSDSSASIAESTKSDESISVSESTSENAHNVADDPKVTLTYAEVNPADSLMGMTAQAFKEAVEELSGGSVTINLQTSGMLGAEGDILATMTSGGGLVDLARISVMSLRSYPDIKVSNLLAVPYIFTGRDHYWDVINSYIGEEIKNECHDVGLNIRGLFFVEEGFRNFFFKDEVSGIDDLAGMKIRVTGDPTSIGIVEGLGATAATIQFTELASALSAGIVDSAEQPIVNYQSNSFNEVAPYMILDGHTMGSGMIIMSDSAWDRLTEAQREVVVQAGKIASDYNRANSASIEEKAISELGTAGVTFIPVDDKKVWRDACVDIITEVTSGLEEYTAYIASLE